MSPTFWNRPDTHIIASHSNIATNTVYIERFSFSRTMKSNAFHLPPRKDLTISRINGTVASTSRYIIFYRERDTLKKKLLKISARLPHFIKEIKIIIAYTQDDPLKNININNNYDPLSFSVETKAINFNRCLRGKIQRLKQ